MLRPNIAVLIGSISRDSINRQLASGLMSLGQSKFNFHELKIDDLPLYNRDLDSQLPREVQRFKAAIEAADGLLIVTPEHNRSIPALLKNAIDWGSRPYGKSSWRGKCAAVAGISGGAIGTALAQQNLRTILTHLDVHVLPVPEVCMKMQDGLFGKDGSIIDASAKSFLEGFVNRFSDFVQQHRGPQ